ncbi:hypothetical protein [Nitratifractor sp.]
MSTVHFAVAVFSDRTMLQKALQSLLDAGIDRKSLSVLSRSDDGERIEKIELEKENSDILLWGEQGALWGGIIGLLLGGAFSIVPGFGPLVGAGAITASIAGLVGGAMTGAGTLGLAAALIEWGIGEEQAHRYERYLREGKALLIIHGDRETTEKAMQILESLSPDRIELH